MNTVTLKMGEFLLTYLDTSYTFLLGHHSRLSASSGGLQERLEKLGTNFIYCADIIKHQKTGKIYKNRFGPGHEVTYKDMDHLYSQVSIHWRTSL